MSRLKLVDFAERVGATFVITFVSLLSVTELTNIKSLEAAALAGALSAGKFGAVQAQAFLNKPPAAEPKAAVKVVAPAAPAPPQ